MLNAFVAIRVSGNTEIPAQEVWAGILLSKGLALAIDAGGELFFLSEFVLRAERESRS